MNGVTRGSISALVVLSALSAGVYADAHAAASKKSVKVVEISSKYAFKAAKITIGAGTKVTWSNTTDAAHTITSTGHPPAKFNKQLALHGKVTLTFTKRGTYHYFCAIHPYMKGTIVVK
jgi:plastocyanin